MTLLTYTLPTIGNPNSSEAPLIRTALSQVLTTVNGSIDSTNIASAAIAADRLAASAKVKFYIPFQGVGPGVQVNFSQSATFTPTGGHCYAFGSLAGLAPQGTQGVWTLALDGVQKGSCTHWWASTAQYLTMPMMVADLGTPSAVLHTLLGSSSNVSWGSSQQFTLFVLELPN